MKIAIHGAGDTGREALALGLAVALKKQAAHHIKILVSPLIGLPDIDLALLCGLDWPRDRTEAGQDSGAKREFEDQRLRHALSEAEVNFR